MLWMPQRSAARSGVRSAAHVPLRVISSSASGAKSTEREAALCNVSGWVPALVYTAVRVMRSSASYTLYRSSTTSPPASFRKTDNVSTPSPVRNMGRPGSCGLPGVTTAWSNTKAAASVPSAYSGMTAGVRLSAVPQPESSCGSRSGQQPGSLWGIRASARLGTSSGRRVP